MDEPQKYVRFDWAMKRLLRQKTNYVILEGFLSTLLGKSIKIDRLLESEGNKDEAASKANRVDILAEDDRKELILIEVQVANESAYFQRMVFGVSKLVTDYIRQGDNYDKVRKVYSINIVYFPLGVGEDTVYHGKTEFVGLHDSSVLKLSQKQKDIFKSTTPSDIFPEYYILRVNDFNKYSKTPLDEWIRFLGTGEISSTTEVAGLPEARKQLAIDRLDKESKAAYYYHLDNMVISDDQIRTSRAEGIIDGRALEKRDIARALKEKNIPSDIIAQTTGLTEEEIKEL